MDAKSRGGQNAELGVRQEKERSGRSLADGDREEKLNRDLPYSLQAPAWISQ